MAPDFLVVGHLTRDLEDDGSWRTGGAALYASVTATRLGLKAGVLTRAAPEDLDGIPAGIDVECLPSEVTTQFANRYAGRRRTQRVEEVAPSIGAEDVPARFKSARVVLLGPVFGEVDSGVGRQLTGCVGVGVQGWLRSRDSEGNVVPLAWAADDVLASAVCLFVSYEDASVSELAKLLRRWRERVEVVVLTDGPEGGVVFNGSQARRIRVFPADEIDPTGAGDVFAAAFLARYAETSDPYESVEFAAAAAACSVEGVGISRIPDRAAIAARREGGHD